MPNFFASPAVQSTTGARGKTTRRRSTRTVRGNDGAYCAMVKEELLARPAWTAFQVRSTTRYADGRVQSFAVMRSADRTTAERYVVDHLARNARYHEHDRKAHGTTYEYTVEEVQVRWEWVRGDVREVVQEGKGEAVLTFPEETRGKGLFLTPAMLTDLLAVDAGLHAELDTHERERLAHGDYFLNVSDDLARRVTLVTHRHACTAHEGT